MMASTMDPFASTSCKNESYCRHQGKIGFCYKAGPPRLWCFGWTHKYDLPYIVAVVFYMLTFFQKWDCGLWKKLHRHLVYVVCLPILAQTDGYGRLRFSCFAWLILVLVFLSREQAAAWKTMRDNNAPCVFDFLEWIYKKLKPGRLCGKNLLPSL